jgi:NitT/TauT family transport system permease protein
MLKRPSKSFYIKIAAVAVWIAVWQLAAVLIGNTLVLASPWKALVSLWGMLSQGVFWRSVSESFYRIALGFLLSAVIGTALAVLSYKVKYVKEFLSPPMTVFKTVPVASFIILLLISLKSKQSLSTIICFIMSLPIIYTNVSAGLNAIDPKMLEMARVFNVSGTKKFAYLYAYKTLPFFATGCKISLGLCWKSGVAAELIGLVQNTIGNELYYAKLYLTMDRVFAWTAVVVALSLVFEFLVLGALKLVKRGLEK